MRLHIRDEPHRRLEEQAVGRAVGIAAYASAWRVFGGVGHAGRGERGGVGHAGVAASLIDERGPQSCRLVELQTVRRPFLGQLRHAIAHTLLPLAGDEVLAVEAKTLLDVGNADRAAEVRPESGQAVVDDVSVSVIESRQHMSTGEIGDPCARPSQAHHLAPARGDHDSAGDGQMCTRGEAAAPESPNAAPSQDQIRHHVADKVRKWPI